MNVNSVMAFVTKADGKIIRVNLIDEKFEYELSKLDFVFDHDTKEYVLQVSDNDKKSKTFKHLRDLGVAFSSGKEWSPSEVFEYLREMGLITGKYTRISWTNLGEYQCTIE